MKLQIILSQTEMCDAVQGYVDRKVKPAEDGRVPRVTFVRVDSNSFYISISLEEEHEG